MVNLTRIYTRTGDDGTTNLGDMSRTGKNDPRLKAYADVDEANSAIGLAIAAGELRTDLAELLTKIQNELFDVGADLCTQDYIERLETACDLYNDELEALRSFILPGGTVGAAHLHVARTVTRRAERSTWAAIDMYHGGMNTLAANYLNRLSDLLFILSRVANKEIGDVLWQPGNTR